MKCPDLFVVRKLRIGRIRGLLRPLVRDRAGDDGAKISALIAHHNHLLRLWQISRNLIFNRFGRKFVA